MIVRTTTRRGRERAPGLSGSTVGRLMTSFNRSVEIRRARRFETATLPAASGRGAAGGHQCILSEGGIVNRAVSDAAGPTSWSPRIIEHDHEIELRSGRTSS